MSDNNEKFGQAYYQKYYLNEKTRVSDQTAINKLAAFASAYFRFLDVEVYQILDLGCGVGHWQKATRKHFPSARYKGVEFSEYLCKKYGWTRGSVVDYHDSRTYDFVVCQGVLQYLDNKQCKHAIENLASLTNSILYLQALTITDWEENADQNVTDGEVFLRSSKWYRRCLSEHFIAIGGGLFVKKDMNLVLYDLEKLCL